MVGCTLGWLVRKGLRQGSPATKATQAKGALVHYPGVGRTVGRRLRSPRGVRICCTDLACPFPYGKGAYTYLYTLTSGDESRWPVCPPFARQLDPGSAP
jgi:hypothetical protein